MRLRNWKGVTPVWFVPKSQRVDVPDDVLVARSVGELPDSGAAIVATAAKWARATKIELPLLVVDEAWQLPFAGFAPLTPLAERYLLVGDPGQIRPVTEVDTSRWSDDPAGPHVPAPVALAKRGIPGLVEVKLPATRRLQESSAELVSRAFYPGMPFGSLADPATLDAPGFIEGESLTVVEMGEERVGEHDPEIASFVAAIVQGVVDKGEVTRNGSTVKVSPEDVGVVVPRVYQVPAVRAALGPQLSGVFVETANRWQGLERDVIVGIHPLSGQSVGTTFSMDAGRLCVMCSRHRVACMLVGRPGLAKAAAVSHGSTERRFGDDDDPARMGWRAHSVLLGR